MLLVFSGMLIAISIIVAIVAVALTAPVSAGPTTIGIACLLAIFARIVQAAAHHAPPPRPKQRDAQPQIAPHIQEQTPEEVAVDRKMAFIAVLGVVIMLIIFVGAAFFSGSFGSR
jgi:hypothetical protein